MPHLFCTQPISNVRIKLMEYTIDDHNNTIINSETLINSKQQVQLTTIIKPMRIINTKPKSNKSTLNNYKELITIRKAKEKMLKQ